MYKSIKKEEIKKQLLADLKKEFKINKGIAAWLNFIKKKGLKEDFLINKEKQWMILEDISRKFAKKYPKYTYCQIIDFLGDLIYCSF